MSDNSYYYLLSAIPQTLAAMLAVVLAVALFRLNEITQILVGDGQSALRRSRRDSNGKADTGYELPTYMRDRLQDAVDRQCIPEISQVLKFLRDVEVEQGYTLKDRPTGLQSLYDLRFGVAHSISQSIRLGTLWSVVLSASAIAISGGALFAGHYVQAPSSSRLIIAAIDLLLYFASIVVILVVGYRCVITRCPHESRPFNDPRQAEYDKMVKQFAQVAKRS